MGLYFLIWKISILNEMSIRKGFPGGSNGRESSCNVGDPGSILGLGTCPEEENGNPLQYLAWKIPRTEEPGELQSTGWPRVGHN